MMQSPINKAQATTAVLRAMMRFASRSRLHCEKIFCSPGLYRTPRERRRLDDDHRMVMWSRRKVISVTLHGVFHTGNHTNSSGVWESRTNGLCVSVLQGVKLLQSLQSVINKRRMWTYFLKTVERQKEDNVFCQFCHDWGNTFIENWLY